MTNTKIGIPKTWNTLGDALDFCGHWNNDSNYIVYTTEASNDGLYRVRVNEKAHNLFLGYVIKEEKELQ